MISQNPSNQLSWKEKKKGAIFQNHSSDHGLQITDRSEPDKHKPLRSSWPLICQVQLP